MPDPVAIKTQLLNKAWDLLEASAGFTAAVRSGNRVKLTHGNGWLQKRMINQPGDLPKAKIECGAMGSTSFAEAGTFAQEDPTFASDPADAWDVVLTPTLTLTLTTDDLKVGTPNLLEEHALIAFLAAGPKFGLPELVERWGPTTSTQEFTNQSDAEGTYRIVTTVRIPFTLRIAGQSLVNPTP